MSFGATKLLAASGGEDYEIDQSAMFDASSTALLYRTPSEAGNRRTFTLSAWVKLTQASEDNSAIFACSTAGNDASTTYISIYQGKLQYQGYSTNYRVTNRLFRDVGAWYHIVWAVDTTIADGSADNRIRLYVNGVEETSFGTKNNPVEDYEFIINSTNRHELGDEGATTGGIAPFDGYMAEVNFIDGSQLTPSSFGKTDAETNAWIPKKYGGAYGTNGFYLKFVSGAIGTDSSGEGNNLTVSNIADADIMLDTPTNNYPTINSALPLDTTLVKLYEGNLRTYGGAQSGGNGQANSYCTFQMPSSGKWYVESYVGIGQGSAGGNNGAIGVIESTFVLPNTDAIMFSQAGFTGLVFDTYTDTAKLYDGGSAVDTDTGLTGTVYVVALAIDVDNGKVYGGYGTTSITWMNSGDPAGDSNGMAHTFSSDTVIGVYLTVDGSSPANTADLRLNFGQNGTFNGGKTAGGNTDSAGEGNFFYSVPSGFKALCTKNFPDPAVKKSTDHFNTVLYTGDGESTRTITGAGFQPNFTWLKSRTEAYSHLLYDAVRGAGASKALKSNSNAVEGENDNATYGYLSAFASDGFSLVHGSSSASFTNENNDNMVAWNWLAGGTAPSKTYAVKVVSDTGNKYRFDDYGTSAVTLNLQEGGTYTFDQSDSSNSGHPLRFSTTSDGSHGGGSEYTTGVTTNGTPGSSGAYTRITVAASAATLYYYCTAHSGMGGQANTNSTFGATNLDGSSLSVVSESTTAGFSVVSYTGTGSTATVGHELGVAPSVIIIKNRGVADDWAVYSRGDATDYLELNTNNATADDNAYWTDTAPTSSVFTIGTAHSVNASSETYVAYCFANVEGFFKSGTYTGNGAAEDGPYVYTGFSPSLVIVKETSEAGGSWFMWDNKREVGNVKDALIWADSTSAETSHAEYEIDFLSNGFKIRGNSGGTNSSGQTNLYMAWAESPFKYATAR